MRKVHVGIDRVISDWEASTIQRTLNQHTSAWLKMLGAGENWGHESRFRETCLNQTASIPALSLLIKDHKRTEPVDLPKTRPVCGS